MSCRSSTRTACTRSTAAGARSSTSTPASASPSPRRGRPPSSALANYVRPDELHQAFNFQYLGTAWDAARAARGRSTARWTRCGRSAPPPPGCCPTTTSPGTPPASPTRRGLGTQIRTAGDRELGLRRARAATAADAGAARLRVRLPGRGARPARRRRPAAGGPPGPGVLPRPPARTASATAAGCRSRGRASAAPYGFGPDGGSWLPQPDGWAELSVEAQDGVARLDPGAVPRRARPAPQAPPAPAAANWSGRTRPPGCWPSTAARRFRCTVNMGAEPVRLAARGDLLLASGPVAVDDGVPSCPRTPPPGGPSESESKCGSAAPPASPAPRTRGSGPPGRSGEQGRPAK